MRKRAVCGAFADEVFQRIGLVHFDEAGEIDGRESAGFAEIARFFGEPDGSDADEVDGVSGFFADVRNQVEKFFDFGLFDEPAAVFGGGSSAVAREYEDGGLFAVLPVFARGIDRSGREF